MNLFRESSTFIGWYSAVMGRLTRVRPVTTITLVLSSVISQLARMLARLLPLQVILLAGSNGVPHYFEPFLAPDHKTIGLVVLTAATVVCIAANLILDAIADKLSETGSRQVVEEANDIVVTDQIQQARASYVRATGIAGDLVLPTVCFIVIGFIDIWLLLVLFASFLVAFVFTAWALRGNLYEVHRPFASFIRSDPRAYLSVLSILSFIIGFLFLLVPFLTGSDANVVLAMVAVTFLRRCLGSLSSAFSSAAKFGQRAHEVNALVFRQHRTLRAERPESRTLREMFARPQRHTQAKRELSRLDRGATSIQTQWYDPLNGVPSFSIDAIDASGVHSRYVERIFSRANISKLDSEEFLFRHVPREALFAPEFLTRFENMPFECQISELGGLARPVPPHSWSEVQVAIVEALWSLKPPGALVDAYRASHTQLHERLDVELFNRVSIAISSERDEQAFGSFIAGLPQILADLRALPLYIGNAGIELRNVLQRETGEPLILNWSRWSIEPFGTGQLPARGDANALAAMLDRIRSRRNDVPAALGPEKILLAATCAELERAIERGMYQWGLRLAEGIVAGTEAENRPINMEFEEGELL